MMYILILLDGEWFKLTNCATIMTINVSALLTILKYVCVLMVLSGSCEISLVQCSPGFLQGNNFCFIHSFLSLNVILGPYPKSLNPFNLRS